MYQRPTMLGGGGGAEATWAEGPSMQFKQIKASNKEIAEAAAPSPSGAPLAIQAPPLNVPCALSSLEGPTLSSCGDGY